MWLDILIVALTAVAFVMAVIKAIRNRGKGCCGNCEGCQNGCKRAE